MGTTARRLGLSGRRARRKRFKTYLNGSFRSEESGAYSGGSDGEVHTMSCLLEPRTALLTTNERNPGLSSMLESTTCV